MNKTLNFKSLKMLLATAVSTLLYWVLFLCANTNSSALIYQPKAPTSLNKFKLN